MNMNAEKERLEQVLTGQHRLLDEVHQLLAEADKQDEVIRAVVLSSNKERAVPINGLDPQRVFHRDAIKALCVKYRLRFLDAGLFKGPIPSGAVHAIRQLERQAGQPLISYKVMAPAERFRLCDSEVDPLLFIPLGADRYYLVHKWGNDLKWYRSLLGWPFRGPVQLALVVLAVALVLALVMPTWLITKDPQAVHWGAHRVLFFFWSAMVCASFTVFAWFAFFGQFSAQAWNSRYFN